MPEREFFDVTIERKVLSLMACDSDLFLRVYHRGLPDDGIFADISHRIIYKCVSQSYLKHARLPDLELVQNSIKRIKTTKKIKNSIKENAKIIAERIYSYEKSGVDVEKFDLYYDEMSKLYEARQIQAHVIKVVRQIDDADIDSAIEETASFSVKRANEDVEEFDFIDGLRERFDRINHFKKNYDKMRPVTSGIMELDVVLNGGYQSELVMVCGNSNAGKSSYLHQFCVEAARKNKHGILFTIEMNKVEAATRIDSSLSGIPLDKFRNPVENKFGKFTQEDVHAWKKCIEELKEKGKLHIVAFLRGATMADIQAKTHSIMRKWKHNVDYVAIDYLNDLKPSAPGKNKSDKDWDAQGTISWDMHLMAKFFKNYDGSRGLPVVTAASLSKKSKSVSSNRKDSDKRKMDERDIGLSPLLFQHSDTVLGIGEWDENMNQMIVMKGRGVPRGDVINIFPNKPYGRFHDPYKAAEIAGLLEAERDDSPDGVEMEEA